MMFPKPTYKKRKLASVQKIHLQTYPECWHCGTVSNNLQVHHVFGSALRDKSTQYGLTVYLCLKHHTGSQAGDKGIHHNAEMMDKLKRYAQTEFIKVYGMEMWMQEFGKSYL